MDEITAYVKEIGDHIYIQSPVKLYSPDDAEIETFAFKDAVKGLGSTATVKDQAPNPKIVWMQGRYVEADKANGNADQWTAGELAIKSLTPVLMPITVMHDMRSAVGVIAHTAVKLPKDDESIPRARLENILAGWGHRFPEVMEEAKINAQQGSLMQSMECISPYYDCSICGEMFERHQGWAEEWKGHSTAHIQASTGDLRSAARILRSVVFTGTGLIFGTRGARGAYSEANVEVEALAELHEKAHRDRAPSRKPRRPQGIMDIEDAKYAELLAQAEVAKKVPALESTVAAAEKKVEEAEAAKLKAEEERDAAKREADEAKEGARVAELRDERLAKLGSGFTAKLDKLETTKARVLKQAGTLSDEDWTARIAELEETLSVKSDAKLDEGKEGEDGKDEKDESTAGLLFDREEVTAAAVSRPSGESSAGSVPSQTARQSVIGGLVRPRKPATQSAGK